MAERLTRQQVPGRERWLRLLLLADGCCQQPAATGPIERPVHLLWRRRQLLLPLVLLLLHPLSMVLWLWLQLLLLLW